MATPSKAEVTQMWPGQPSPWATTATSPCRQPRIRPANPTKPAQLGKQPSFAEDRATPPQGRQAAQAAPPLPATPTTTGPANSKHEQRGRWATAHPDHCESSWCPTKGRSPVPECGEHPGHRYGEPPRPTPTKGRRRRPSGSTRGTHRLDTAMNDHVLCTASRGDPTRRCPRMHRGN